MYNRVYIVNDYCAGTTHVDVAGAGELCQLPFDKTYLLPELRRQLKFADPSMDWEALKAACQQMIDEAEPMRSGTDPLRNRYPNWRP